MRNLWVNTRRGQVVLSFGDLKPGPVVVMFHGAFRTGAVFQDLASRVDNPVIAHLPDHEGPPLDEMGVWAYIDAFREAVSGVFEGRQVIAVGESIGGLVAMGLNADAIIAFDPPMSTGKLWPIRSWVRRFQPNFRLAESLFGKDIGASNSIDYYPISENISCPTSIVLGTIPLGEERELLRPPCLNEQDDVKHLLSNPNINVRFVIGAGHDLLTVYPDAAFSAVNAAIQKFHPEVRA